jgi:hypothetical protein
MHSGLWKSGFLAMMVAFCLLPGGCAPLRWEALTEPQNGFAWPSPPGAAKAVHVGSIQRFHQVGHSLSSLLTGKSELGRLGQPVAVAVEKDGRMAIADAGRKGIHYYIPAQKTYRFLRQTPAGELQSPVGVAFDGLYNLYVTDSLLAKVFIFDPAGNPKGVIDRAGTGPLGRPTGISFQKPGGRLHVVDTARHQIHVYDTGDGDFDLSYYRSIGSRGTAAGSFNFPSHVTADHRGFILVNDALNFRIQLFQNYEHTYSFGRHGNGSGDFAMSKGLAADRWDTIYVVDSLFDAVQLFDRDGRFLLAIGARGIGVGEFWLPSGLFIDARDRLYVCDTYNSRIQIFQLFPDPGTL